MASFRSSNLLINSDYGWLPPGAPVAHCHLVLSSHFYVQLLLSVRWSFVYPLLHAAHVSKVKVLVISVSVSVRGVTYVSIPLLWLMSVSTPRLKNMMLHLTNSSSTTLPQATSTETCLLNVHLNNNSQSLCILMRVRRAVYITYVHLFILLKPD